MAINKPLPNGKLLGLEILRFVAALSVLVWHYQHFFFTPTNSNKYIRESQPFYSFLKLFYEHGSYGVQIFWCISGFIFFWKYRNAIASNLVSAKQFFILRLSRLYPLHISTLLIVALLQPIYFHLSNIYFVYQSNDLKHFFLQLFLASNWGFEVGTSFNGPIWSISVEVLIYLVFFLMLLLISKSVWVNIGIALVCTAASLLKNLPIPSALISCMAYFYAGGLAAIALQKIQGGKFIRPVNIFCIFLALVFPVTAYVQGEFPNEKFITLILVIYTPALLLLLAQQIVISGKVQKIIEIAGNMTYASYLLHFPIQLITAIAYGYAEITIPAHENLFFISYIAITLIASYFTYKYLESPAQSLIREKFLSSRCELPVKFFS